MCSKQSVVLAVDVRAGCSRPPPKEIDRRCRLSGCDSSLDEILSIIDNASSSSSGGGAGKVDQKQRSACYEFESSKFDAKLQARRQTAISADIEEIWVKRDMYDALNAISLLKVKLEYNNEQLCPSFLSLQ